MDIGEKIKTYFKEAEIYSSQGLLDEALEKYRSVEGLIKSNRSIKNKRALIKKIATKIEGINKKLKIEDSGKKAPEVAEDAQKLMKEMFSFDDPEIKGSSSLGGAIALAKFGQYDKAIEELTRLLEYDKLRLEAAKNILWCWFKQNYTEYGLSLYQKWKKTNFFTPKEAESIRTYFQEILTEAGIDMDLSEIDHQEGTVEPTSEIADDDILDISAIRFSIPGGARKGEKVDMDVGFQSGTYLRIIIPKKEKQLIKGIKQGDMLKEIIFYSPMAIFSGTGFVSSKKEIETGPKRGDFSIEIKIIKIAS